ncbi:MAG TPA: cytochrome c3 family protein, partial [Aggregatilineales bacterium]|nr:cytochrome c3 family protein [Aggregatilineales bacterium]
MNYRRLLYFSLIGMGCMLLMIGFAANISFAQDDEAEYVGERECSSCHRDLGRSHETSAHVLTLQEAENILADFAQGEDVRLVQFPGDSESRAFSADDVAYVVGSGRYVQRYLFEVDRDEYRVFPAEWNVEAQSWQPFVLADSWDDPAYNWNQNCAGCHTTGLNISRGSWEDDGVQCEACHGPGSIHVEEADDAGSSPSDREFEAIRESIVVNPDAQICGQCHSRGTDGDYAFPTEYKPGQSLLDNYTLAVADDPVHWWDSSHAKQANMQFNEWFDSAHANALTTVQGSDAVADTCLTCHSTDYVHIQDLIAATEAGEREGDAPEALTAETAQFGVTCIGCHPAHQSEEQPILVDEQYSLCINCHSNPEGEMHHPVREIFEGLPIVDNVEPRPSEHFTTENGPDCIACHMLAVPINPSGERVTHSLQPVIPGATDELAIDSCTGCHTDLSPDYLGDFIAGAQEKVTTRLENANTALANVENPPEWVTTALTAVEGDGSGGVHNVAYTTALLDAVELELGLVQTTGIAGAALPVVNPSECAECHQDEHRQWQASPHANASLNDTFLQQYAEQNRPGYCMNCHASGYSPDTGTHEFEGVICTSCHTAVTSAEKHPPAPLDIGDAS